MIIQIEHTSVNGDLRFRKFQEYCPKPRFGIDVSNRIRFFSVVQLLWTSDKKRTVISNLLLIFFLVFTTHAWTQTAVIVSPVPNPPGPVITGIEELERVLHQEGWSVTRSMGKPLAANTALVEFVVAINNPADTKQPGMEMLKDVVSTQPESLAVLVFPRGESTRIYAVGSDPTGAMYAAFEVAEQILISTRDRPLSQRIHEVKQTPHIPVRGVKVMLQADSLEDRLSWLHSEDFWSGFLLRMAKSRFNFLDVHGIYSLRQGRYENLFAHLYPQFFPNSGVVAENASRLRSSLRLIIDMAHKHGLRVNLQNSDYRAVSPGNQREESQIAATTLTNVISQMMQDFPSLDGVGITLPEVSSHLGSFVSAMGPLLQSQNPPLLFLQPGKSSGNTIQSFINSFSGRSVLTVDFNGEILSKPYIVTGARSEEWNGTSYQNFLNQPRKHGVVFDIRSNGTHRIFPWGNVPFIRRTLESSLYCGANGFILETYSTFASHGDAFTNNTDANQSYYEWTHERDWYFFLLWGRLAFDPSTPDTFFVQNFNQYFSPQAGERMFQALQNFSEVIPVLASLVDHGPLRINFAPEINPPPPMQNLLRSQPLDPLTTRSIQEEVQAIASGAPNAKQSPREQLDMAVEKAQKATVLIQQVGESLSYTLNINPEMLHETEARQYREWQSWMLNSQALYALAQTWLHQVNAAISYGLYLSTGDVPSLLIASESSKKAQEAWNEVVMYTRAHYLPIEQETRAGTQNIHWSTFPTPWADDQALIERAYGEWSASQNWNEGRGHLPVHRAMPMKNLVLSLSIPPSIEVGGLFLNYKNASGQTGLNKMETTQIPGVYVAQIPSSVVEPGVMQYYFYGNIQEEMIELMAPNSTKPFLTAITLDRSPPQVSDFNHTASKDRVTVSATVTDTSDIYEVNLLWKPLPSSSQWTVSAMNRAGNRYIGDFPLTSAGAQYAVQVVDNYGNGQHLPDPTYETPYRTIPPSAQK